MPVFRQCESMNDSSSSHQSQVVSGLIGRAIEVVRRYRPVCFLFLKGGKRDSRFWLDFSASRRTVLSRKLSIVFMRGRVVKKKIRHNSIYESILI